MNTSMFQVSTAQFKRVGIGMILAMLLSGVAYLSGLLPTMITNPLVLTIFVGVIDLIKKFLTDEQGKFLGSI